MADQGQYASEWKEWTIVPAGAGWAFAVGIIEQAGGRLKVRVAKGKMKAVGSGELPITGKSQDAPAYARRGMVGKRFAVSNPLGLFPWQNPGLWPEFCT